MQQLSLFDLLPQPPANPMPPQPLLPTVLADWTIFQTPARIDEPCGWALWHRPTGLTTRAFVRSRAAIDEAYRIAVFFEWLPEAELAFQWRTNPQWFRTLPAPQYLRWWPLVLRAR